MAAPKRLRVATADEPVTPKKPMSLVEAIEHGTYVEILIAQRREAVLDLPDLGGPAKAALHRQIALLSKEIDGLLAAAAQEASEDVEVDDADFDASAV